MHRYHFRKQISEHADCRLPIRNPKQMRGHYFHFRSLRLWEFMRMLK